jgi:hypothetical protein
VAPRASLNPRKKSSNVSSWPYEPDLEPVVVVEVVAVESIVSPLADENDIQIAVAVEVEDRRPATVHAGIGESHVSNQPEACAPVVAVNTQRSADIDVEVGIVIEIAQGCRVVA